MGKIAFVFSGQGAQYKGMGRELYDNIEASRKVFDVLDELRPGTSEQCFEAEKDELAETKNTQPCMFAVELAVAAALNSAGIKANVTAGFSLGELAALTYAEAVSLETGFSLVCKRGALMQTASEALDTSMAAVLKLSNDDIERLCSEFDHIYPVNYNCPGQLSVAGMNSEMKDFMQRVKAEGGRALPIKVRGGFHSPFMKDAAESFGELLMKTKFNKTCIDLYSDFTGMVYGEDVSKYAELLSHQISNPVRWQKIVEGMIESGVDTFIELGPGQTLVNLIKKTNDSVKTLNVEDMESLNKTVSEISTGL